MSLKGTLGTALQIAGIAIPFVPGFGQIAWGLRMAIVLGLPTLGGYLRATGGPGAAGHAARLDRAIANVLSNEAALPVIYGRTKVGVTIVDVRVDSAAPTSTDIYIVAAIAVASESGAGIEAIDEVYLDERLAILNPVFESEPSTSGVQSPFGGKLEYGLHRGADNQTVDAELLSVHTEYDADTAGRGIAYITLKLSQNSDVFPTGIPKITVIAKGNRVWDPRGTPAWGYSDSPALCVLDYLTSKRYGAGVLYSERDGGGTSEIDEQSFIDAANYHDDSITQGPSSGTRFTCNGRLDTGRPIQTNLAELLTAARSDLVYEGGKFRLITRQAVTAETFELDASNIVGEVEYWRGGTAQVPNRVICHFVDEDNDWSPQEVMWPEASQTNSFLTADNDFENVLEIRLPYTVGYYRAQQIGMVALREAREDTGIALTVKEEALKLRVGEVVPVTHARAGFSATEFWVRAIGLNPDNTVRLVLQEYDSAAYSLDAQNTRDTLPASSLPDQNTVEVPTGVSFLADDTTALPTQADQYVPRGKLSWTASVHPFLANYEIQVKLNSEPSTDWRSAVADPLSPDVEAWINGLTAAVNIDVRLRAVNTIGVASAWVTLTNQSVSTSALNGVLDVALIPVMQGSSRRHEFQYTYRWEADVDEAEVRLSWTEPGPTFITLVKVMTQSGDGVARVEENLSSTIAKIPEDATDLLFTIKGRNSAATSKWGNSFSWRLDDMADATAGMRTSDGTTEYLSKRSLIGRGLSLALVAGEPEIRLETAVEGAGSKSADFTLDAADGLIQSVSISASVDLTNISNLIGSEPFLLRLSAGANTLTLDAANFEGPKLAFTGTAAISFVDFGTGKIVAMGGDW